MQTDRKNMVLIRATQEERPLKMVHDIKGKSVLHESLVLFGKGSLPGNSDIHPVKVAKATSQSDGGEIPVAESVFRSEINDIPTFKARDTWSQPILMSSSDDPKVIKLDEWKNLLCYGITCMPTGVDLRAFLIVIEGDNTANGSL